MRFYFSFTIIIRHILYFLSASLIFINCTQETNSLRTLNGSVLEAKTYQLELSDTNKILTKLNDLYSLNTFDDSLITKTDTIFHKIPNPGEYEKLFGKVDQTVIYNSNKNVKELYRFESEKVFLAGYVYDNDEKQYNKFNPPLIILPHADTIIDTTFSLMMKWNPRKKIFEGGLNTKSSVKLIKRGKLQIENVQEEFYLYELTIQQDTKINYGEQGLILPDAITLKSNLLYLKDRGLIAEWCIRIKQTTGKANKGEPTREPYLELNKYYKINKEKTE
ncbi:MAG: hypothetical protein PVH88_02640 [Ignavibacteria bacterium]|jgi:hypothetical protein